MEKSKIIPIKPKQITIIGVDVLERCFFVDKRGFLIETFSASKEKLPCVYSYSSLIHPNCAKDVDKFHYHQKQIDRFTVVVGRLWLLLYDNRINSSTYKKLEVVELEGESTKVIKETTLPAFTVTIPQGVYHGIKNPGSETSILVNHPTCEYNPENEGRTLFSKVPIDLLNGQCFSWELV